MSPSRHGHSHWVGKDAKDAKSRRSGRMRGQKKGRAVARPARFLGPFRTDYVGLSRFCECAKGLAGGVRRSRDFLLRSVRPIGIASGDKAKKPKVMRVSFWEVGLELYARLQYSRNDLLDSAISMQFRMANLQNLRSGKRRPGM